jgi:hypothetical protein
LIWLNDACWSSNGHPRPPCEELMSGSLAQISAAPPTSKLPQTQAPEATQALTPRRDRRVGNYATRRGLPPSKHGTVVKVASLAIGRKKRRLDTYEAGLRVGLLSSQVPLQLAHVLREAR